MSLFAPKGVRPKKHLGQHFLTDLSIAEKIAQSIYPTAEGLPVVEVGPGMGVLTNYLLPLCPKLICVEIDRDSAAFLRENSPIVAKHLIEGDFLRIDLKRLFEEKKGAVIGNFPYNISSQILFHCLDYHIHVPVIAGMFQKEVAERIASVHGNKTYGILSVLMQAYYDVEYLFTVHEHVFNPPPKVKSAVIRLIHKPLEQIEVPDAVLKEIVKTAFNQRRKTLHNALKPLGTKYLTVPERFAMKRAEQLSVHEFIEMTKEMMKP